MVGQTWHLGLVLGLKAGWAAAHPLCYVNDKPTNPDQVLTFCPAAQDGACCTDLEEAEIKASFDAFNLSGDCADIFKQVKRIEVLSRQSASFFGGVSVKCAHGRRSAPCTTNDTLSCYM